MDENLRRRMRGGRRDYTRLVQRTSRPIRQTTHAKPQSTRPELSDASPAARFRLIHIPKKVGLTLAVLILAAAGLTGGWWLLTNNSGGPLPKTVLKQAGFPVYYPSSLPAGYVLDKQSPSFDKGIVFYVLSNGSDKISVSEQAAPVNPPDFDALQKFNTSFKKLEVPGGSAIYGLSQKVPVSILLTNTTLVNLSGSKDVPLDALANITQNINSSFSQD